MRLSKQRTLPFLVADRQASLRLLAGIDLPQGKKIGLMTHANTSPEFQRAFRGFPCVAPEACPIVGNKACPYDVDLALCTKGRRIRTSLVRICDSGVFTKQGQSPGDYERLFETYHRTGADYGVIADVLKDKRSTLRSARKAIAVYRSKPRSFRLIGVAQGQTVEEYLECYRALKRMGYSRIAVGGMLHKKVNSARYVHVRDERFLRRVLLAVREIDPNGWVFALGCYSPGRHALLAELGIVGADYKGWIFQYTGRSPRRFFRPHQRSRFRQVREFIRNRVLSQPQNQANLRRLILTSCSMTKRAGRSPREAIQVYDGPTFRLLRRWLPDFGNENGIDVLILSAKYGLIEPTKRIKAYDQQLTYSRAEEIRPDVVDACRSWNARKHYHSVLVNLAGPYLHALGNPEEVFREVNDVRVLSGRIGTRLSEMRNWITLSA